MTYLLHECCAFPSCSYLDVAPLKCATAVVLFSARVMFVTKTCLRGWSMDQCEADTYNSSTKSSVDFDHCINVDIEITLSFRKIKYAIMQLHKITFVPILSAATLKRNIADFHIERIIFLNINSMIDDWEMEQKIMLNCVHLILKYRILNTKHLYCTCFKGKYNIGNFQIIKLLN